MSKATEKRSTSINPGGSDDWEAGPAATNPDHPTKADPGSKQSRVIAMLQSPAGATIAAMMEATGWQQHSVRGFLAGVVRKRLKLKLGSKKVDGNRVYQIASARAGKIPASLVQAQAVLSAMPRVKIGPALPDRKALDVEIARLRDLDIGDLQARWHTVFGRRAAPSRAPPSAVSRPGVPASGRSVG